MARIQLPPASCGCPRYQEDDKTVCSHMDATCKGKEKKKRK
jgi:hypothetical protein